jgi:hypothetical protein
VLACSNFSLKCSNGVVVELSHVGGDVGPWWTRWQGLAGSCGCILVLFEQADLLACLLPGLLVVSLSTTILCHLTFGSILKRAPSTFEATCACNGRRFPGRQPMPSRFVGLVLDLSRCRQSLMRASTTAIRLRSSIHRTCDCRDHTAGASSSIEAGCPNAVAISLDLSISNSSTLAQPQQLYASTSSGRIRHIACKGARKSTEAATSHIWRSG